MAPVAATISIASSLSLSFPFSLPQQQKKQQLKRKLRPLRAQSFQVTLRTPAGETVLCVPDDVYISDAAEAAGIELPISCRSGNCSACAAVLRSGEVDQSDQMFLDDSRVAQGFVLTCVAYPLSDLVLETHQEARLYSDS